MDVTSPSSVAEAAAEVGKAFGKLRTLVNNAGIVGNYGLIEWMQVIDMNLQGPYLVAHAFLPFLL